jgi:alpha-L-fucosidase
MAISLNLSVRVDGTIDEDEHQFIIDPSSWMNTNGRAIYLHSPVRRLRRGTPDVADSSMFNESKASTL